MNGCLFALIIGLVYGAIIIQKFITQRYQSFVETEV